VLNGTGFCSFAFRWEHDVHAAAGKPRQFLGHDQAWTEQRGFLWTGFPKTTDIMQMVRNHGDGGAWVLLSFGERATQEQEAVIASLLGLREIVLPPVVVRREAPAVKDFIDGTLIQRVHQGVIILGNERVEVKGLLVMRVPVTPENRDNLLVLVLQLSDELLA
jgi:hypothetical protein